MIHSHSMNLDHLGHFRRVDHGSEHDRHHGRTMSAGLGCCVVVEVDDFEGDYCGAGPVVREALRSAVSTMIVNHLGADDITLVGNPSQIVIQKSTESALKAWIWAEELRQAICDMSVVTDLHPPEVTVSLGLSSFGPFAESQIREAAEALALAVDLRGNTVCVEPLRTLAADLAAVRQHPEWDVEERRHGLLTTMARRLGPVQWEHVSDHCARVSRLAAKIARFCRMETVDIERVRIAGLMHDIGKCVVPESLLAKPQVLTPSESCIMAYHERYGVWIAQQLGLDPVMIEHIRDHHARYDASIVKSIYEEEGRMAQNWESNTLGAAVLCVADAVVTMLSTRPYRVARSVGHALAELRQQRGWQFHPTAVDAAHRIHSIQELAAA